MAESITPAKCTEAEFEAARAAGLLVVTTADEIAIHKFAEAMRAQAQAAGADLTPPEVLASRLIDAWCGAHGKQIPWAKAVEITAIVTRLSDDEKARLLALD